MIKVNGFAEHGDDAIPGGIVDPDVLDILHLAEVQVYAAEADDVQRLAWWGVELRQTLSMRGCLSNIYRYTPPVSLQELATGPCGDRRGCGR